MACKPEGVNPVTFLPQWLWQVFVKNPILTLSNWSHCRVTAEGYICMHMYIIFRLYGCIVYIAYSQMITLSIVFVIATIKQSMHYNNKKMSNIINAA